jgi:hypothetical protein
MKFKMTKNNVLKRARKIFEENGVIGDVHYDIRGGWAYPRDNYVIIGTREYTVNQLASTICHELAHILNLRNRKFFRYHDFGLKTVYTKELAQMRIQIGLKAELYTDEVAKRLMKEHYPELRFIKCYDTKNGRKFYREVFLKPVREFLKGVE